MNLQVWGFRGWSQKGSGPKSTGVSEALGVHMEQEFRQFGLSGVLGGLCKGLGWGLSGSNKGLNWV